MGGDFWAVIVLFLGIPLWGVFVILTLSFFAGGQSVELTKKCQACGTMVSWRVDIDVLEAEREKWIRNYSEHGGKNEKETKEADS